MKDNLEMFLLVAEELNFTKAAEKAFVSQQTASYHIKTLEDQYKVKLFNRRPNLSLTEAGQFLYQSLKNLKSMEKSIAEGLSDYTGESIGELKVGINTVRARILNPGVLAKYMKIFPKISTNFFIYDTYILSDMLINQEINMFMGVNTRANPAFKRLKLKDENIYLLATKKFLKDHKGFTDQEISKLHKEGININSLDGLPFIRNLKGCALTQVLDRTITKYDIAIPENINTSDYDIQIDLCGSSLASAFCPSMILYRVIEHNQLNKGSDREILIFKINDLEESLRIDIVTSALIPAPKYLSLFIDELTREAKEKYDYLQAWLEAYFSTDL
ncbi:MAG: LysR family transcriptional regulator [Bacillota bacterium]|nr:LysR family transcriptional regulator [Bacillota bacterium]